MISSEDEPVFEYACLYLEKEIARLEDELLKTRSRPLSPGVRDSLRERIDGFRFELAYIYLRMGKHLD